MGAPLVLRGTLTEDARGRTGRDGMADLTLRMLTRAGALGTGVPAQAHKLYGTGHAAQAARDARLRQLRRGLRVEVQGTGDLRRGRIVMEADQIITPDVFDARALASGSEATA